ncbi:putative DNA helicase ino80 [Coemansia sp. RSA 1813]|nr:putative DNA helicase ino80 [Coemansia sp. RSA 1646]KAJ1770512.1 putative DNA helicase ino80 [Coemansia sp. RSA 1843]KAJ2092951.1 putative DNA helicase ino80 [Coemansia sp. RSA 986]KAJ2216272.1 putative DNA helicase ino80 [Coemansia sp. RSA 487]KAJ2570556.1 putative DNA helicase ino80 [Coemansia sp. RSA 1813]
MSYDQSPSSRHNLNSLLSPHSSKSGADGDAAQNNESHYTQQQQQHPASYQASDNAYRQSAPYQSPPQQQQRPQHVQPRQNEYSQYDPIYEQPRPDMNTTVSDYPESVYDQYAYPDARVQKYSQTQYDERASVSGHPEYSDYRDAYGRPEYGYTDAAARGQPQQYHYQQHRAPVYEYDYEYEQRRREHDAHGVHDRSAYPRGDVQQTPQQPYAYDSQHRHASGEYYSRRYDYDAARAYGQDPANVEPVVDHGHAAQQLPPPSSSGVYYDYRQGDIPPDSRGTYEQAGRAHERDYAMHAPAGDVSGQQSYRYGAAGPPVYSPYKGSPAPAIYPTEAEYRPNAHGSSSQVYQRESPVYGSTSRYSMDPYAAADRMVYAGEKEIPRQSTGIGITSLLSEAAASTSPRDTRTPVAGYSDRRHYDEYSRQGGYAYAYGGSADHYRHGYNDAAYPDPYEETQHRVMSISQLVGGDADTPATRMPGNMARGYDYSGPDGKEVYDLRTPPPNTYPEQHLAAPNPPQGAPMHGAEFSPDAPLVRRHGQWDDQSGLVGQEEVVISDTETQDVQPYRDVSRPMADNDDDDSRPLASRADIASKASEESPKPASKRRKQSQRGRGRRSANMAKAAIAAAAANDTASDVVTDDNTANGASAGRRRPQRRPRNAKKVELSREFIYDDEDDEAGAIDVDDIPLEQSTAGLGAHRYSRGSPGDQEVAAPNSRLFDESNSHNMAGDDYTVDEHVQAYIHHVHQRTERAIAKYEEGARRKSQRMHEHIVHRYGPYLRGYFDSVGRNGSGEYDERFAQDRHRYHEDEYETVDEHMRGPTANGSGGLHARSFRHRNGFADGLEDSPIYMSNGHLQPPPMGYFTPSVPISPNGYNVGYGRDGTPGSVTSETLAQLAHEEIPLGYHESVEMQEASNRSALWSRLAVDHVPRAFRHLQANVQVRNANMRRVTQLCQREIRRVYGPAPTRTSQLNPNQPILVQRPPKELIMRARRGMREMLMFWKRHEKEEREMRKRAEKEAAERQKQEEEAREGRRQARKLNFLITQTELYSHFIGDKIGDGANPADDEKLKGDAGTVKKFGSIDFDEEDDASLAAHARKNAQNALAKQQAQAREFDDVRSNQHAGASGKHKGGKQELDGSQDANVAGVLDTMDLQEPELISGTEIPQPRMLMCQLKEYQLKGLNWLANLYEQGINGILADEMGLGKTVQSISLLAYLAETHNIWGPFMVVAPASTLHNWQQELSRFVPEFKVLPYWGSQKDRKVLRKSLWNPTSLSRKDSAFHVLVTSYQLVVSDEPYLNRVKWQYMVLDEAQAIKSSSSARWKTLLGFHCRNRLLLTGTPIQNSMQELWALLHFIMPTLFDSHEEFSEWFARDIESHAENRTDLNQHQLHRLHMILKPFMLRRNKRHVQHELGEKIEHLVPCDLTKRQKDMYRGLMSKISIPELMERLQSGSGHGSKEDSDESLMNLVMQFRKVCSHPELFERAEVDSPFMFGVFPTAGSLLREGDELSCAYASRSIVSLPLPKMLYRDSLVTPNLLTQRQSALNRLSLWTPHNISKDCSADGLLGLLRICTPSVGQAVRAFSSPLAELLDDSAEEEARSAARSQYNFMLQSEASSDKTPAVLCNSEPGSVLHALSNVFAPQNLSVSPNMSGLATITQMEFCTSYMSLVAPAYKPSVVSPPVDLVVRDMSAASENEDFMLRNPLSKRITCGRRSLDDWTRPFRSQGITDIWMPSMDKLIRYSGKMSVLDKLLTQLKQEGHRVLLYFQMTKMIDLFEEYLAYRKHTYLRLDGSSKISDRRDMVMDWQTRDDIFIFLLSTRAGGLGINLTAADTVIFFESDWNPTVDSQAMDRAHRLGQTKQVVVYRLITRGTVEERILQRARQKDEIHRIVISGGDGVSAGASGQAGAEGTDEQGAAITEGFSSNFEPSSKEIVSLLLGETTDDESTSRSVRLSMARRAQATSNHIYGGGGYPGMLDMKLLDKLKNSSSGDEEEEETGNLDVWDKVVLLPPPNPNAVLLAHDGGMSAVSSRTLPGKLDSVFNTAIQEQLIEKERQQRQQRQQRLRGSGRGGRRGGGTPREKRKPRSTVAGVKREHTSANGSIAGSRADTPEPNSKRMRANAASTTSTPKEGEPAETTATSATVAI